MCGWCGTPLGGGVAPAPVPAPASAAPAGVADAEIGGSETLPAGSVLIGRYRIEATLGRGGFGITYRAWDQRLHRFIAIKELFPVVAKRHGERVVVGPAHQLAFDDSSRRFQREAASLARFSHPGIVRVFEVFEANDTAYLVMELIDGMSMSDVLEQRGRPLEVDEVLDIVVRVGQALTVVHDAGMLHRDVNPSNIMIERGQRVVLIDFGLARRYGDDISGAVTRAVTPGYAPPEQYAGSVQSGPSCDVFGLAATSYKLLTGVTPTNVFDRQAGVDLPAPASLRAEIPALVSAGIMDGMELDPGHRPSSARAFSDRLGLHGVITAGDVVVDPGPTVAHADPDVTIHEVRSLDPTVAPTFASPALLASRQAEAAVPVPDVSRAGPSDIPPQVMPLRTSGSAPWRDGSAAAVGPGGRSRGWVTWPLGVTVCVAVSASPLAVGALVAFVLLPLAATIGDLEVHHHRKRVGSQTRRIHDAGSAVVAPLRYVRNVLVGSLRAIPAVAVAAIGVLVDRTLFDNGIQSAARDATIRSFGVLTALVLIVPSRHAGRSFRSDLGLSTWALWAMEQRRRPGTRTIALWVIALAVVAFSLWLSPEFWPISRG